MEDQKKGFLAWLKRHRKELIIAGISATALIGIIVCMKNRDSVEVLWKSLIGSIEKSPTEVPRISQTNIDKFSQSSATVTEAINTFKIPVSNPEITYQNPFEVSDHIRNLHEGWRASAKKITEAEAMGIILQEGQTLVDAYIKGSVAA